MSVGEGEGGMEVMRREGGRRSGQAAALAINLWSPDAFMWSVAPCAFSAACGSRSKEPSLAYWSWSQQCLRRD